MDIISLILARALDEGSDNPSANDVSYNPSTSTGLISTDVQGAIDELSERGGLRNRVVNSLPTTGEEGIMYYVPNNSNENENIYDEYIWLDDNNDYEKLGSTEIDLSGYLKSESITDPYDETQTYEINDYVTYRGNLYKCNTTVTNPESIDLNKWTKIIVMGETDGKYMAKGVDYVTAGQADGSTLGMNATAEGYNVTASGNYSHAEGYKTYAGALGHAEGEYTTANSSSGMLLMASHSEGQGTLSKGSASHAEGYQTSATGNSSHSEGSNTYASGNNGHTEGQFTTASAHNSHAEGNGTYANSLSQHAEGRYNIIDTEDKYAHIIGNGTSTTRSNAFTVSWDGDVCAGRSNGLTNDNKLPTGADVKAYVDSKVSNELLKEFTYTEEKQTNVNAFERYGNCISSTASSNSDSVSNILSIEKIDVTNIAYLVIERFENANGSAQYPAFAYFVDDDTNIRDNVFPAASVTYKKDFSTTSTPSPLPQRYYFDVHSLQGEMYFGICTGVHTKLTFSVEVYYLN